jgi:hypothetical protein
VLLRAFYVLFCETAGRAAAAAATSAFLIFLSFLCMKHDD